MKGLVALRFERIVFLIFTLLISQLIFLSCKTTEKRPADLGDLIVKVVSNPCYGTCEVFDFSLYSNKIMLLEVKANPSSQPIGKYHTEISVSKYEEVISEIEQSAVRSYKRKDIPLLKDGMSYTLLTGQRGKQIETNYTFGENKEIDKFILTVKEIMVNTKWKREPSE